MNKGHSFAIIVSLLMLLVVSSAAIVALSDNTEVEARQVEVDGVDRAFVWEPGFKFSGATFNDNETFMLAFPPNIDVENVSVKYRYSSDPVSTIQYDSVRKMIYGTLTLHPEYDSMNDIIVSFTVDGDPFSESFRLTSPYQTWHNLSYDAPTSNITVYLGSFFTFYWNTANSAGYLDLDATIPSWMVREYSYSAKYICHPTTLGDYNVVNPETSAIITFHVAEPTWNTTLKQFPPAALEYSVPPLIIDLTYDVDNIFIYSPTFMDITGLPKAATYAIIFSEGLTVTSYSYVRQYDPFNPEKEDLGHWNVYYNEGDNAIYGLIPGFVWGNSRLVIELSDGTSKEIYIADNRWGMIDWGWESPEENTIYLGEQVNVGSLVGVEFITPPPEWLTTNLDNGTYARATETGDWLVQYYWIGAESQVYSANIHVIPYPTLTAVFGEDFFGTSGGDDDPTDPTDPGEGEGNGGDGDPTDPGDGEGEGNGGDGDPTDPTDPGEGNGNNGDPEGTDRFAIILICVVIVIILIIVAAYFSRRGD